MVRQSPSSLTANIPRETRTSAREPSKVIGWIITPPYLILFFSILCAFHLPIVAAHKLTGRFPRRILEWMCHCLLWNLRFVAGVHFSVCRPPPKSTSTPMILVGNHQGMYDIPLIIASLPDIAPNFVSKKELGRNIPSISYALRHMGSTLIDRKDAQGAVDSIAAFGAEIEAGKHSGCIFPEGTRARDGVMKRFKPGGLTAILNAAPNAEVVPLMIDGSWKILRYGFKPVPYGARVVLELLEPIPVSQAPASELISIVEARIRAAQAAYRGAGE